LGYCGGMSEPTPEAAAATTAPPPEAETPGATPDPKDHRVLAAGTAQNIVGLAVFVLGTFGANILVSRLFGGGDAGAVALGVVTLGTQFAFIAAAGTRFGMDMAAVRYVAIEVGAGHPGRARGIVNRAALIAFAVSAVVGVVTFLFAGPLGRALSQPNTEDAAVRAMQAAAVALPFIALTYTWLGASRGLKIMRHTLYVQWVGQPILWIGFMVVFWAVVAETVGSLVFAYSASWILSAAAAWFFWNRETKRLGSEPVDPDTTSTLARYGAPRAPAALMSQALFWVDYFVAAAFVSSGQVTDAELGVYSACVRVALAMVLFLTAVSYVFSPFVADLHTRGETERLDALFKSITRWTVAGTIPILLLMLVAPAQILQLFGGEAFTEGTTPLRILVIGQAVNVSVGAAGFVLIMAGRTGWDLIVYGFSFLLDIVLSVILVSAFGITGAAIAQAVTIACSNALRLWLVHRFVHIQPWDRNYVRLAIPAAACALAMVAAHSVLKDAAWPVVLAGTALVGGVVYAPLAVVFGLTASEKQALKGFASSRGR
jgi:O-antigen/teichoic acid export membrane protein